MLSHILEYFLLLLPHPLHPVVLFVPLPVRQHPGDPHPRLQALLEPASLAAPPGGQGDLAALPPLAEEDLVVLGLHGAAEEGAAARANLLPGIMIYGSTAFFKIIKIAKNIQAKPVLRSSCASPPFRRKHSRSELHRVTHLLPVKKKKYH